MSFQSISRNLLRRFGVVAIRANHPAAKYVHAPPASVFDAILLRVFPGIEGLRFIQIGANDGVRSDPVRKMVLDHSWTGVLVEPLPSLFSQLRDNYAGRLGLKFINAAVDKSSGPRAFYSLRPGLSVPDWAHGLATFDLQHLQATAKSLGLLDEDIARQDVETITWERLLEEFGGKSCDVLVIDAEGYDISLLRAAPLARWHPRVIQFEHSFAATPERMLFYGELIALGYEVASDGPDTIAWLNPGAPS